MGRLRIAALLLAGVLGISGSVIIFGSDSSTSHTVNCDDSSPHAHPTSSPGGTLAQQQLDNAKAVARAGQEAGVGGRGILIALTVAVGESDLIALDHGDASGPDSRGIFQQRASWGSEADRMDPYTSAQKFFAHLLRVPGWPQMSITDAGHAVQANADPSHYASFQSRAEAIAKKADIDLSQAITAPTTRDGDMAPTLISGQASCSAAFRSTKDPSGKDDYPYRDWDHCQETPTGVYIPGTCPAGSPLGALPRECVDFALWRLNQEAGTTAPPFKVSVHGNATDWLGVWTARGWPVGHDPKPGAVVYYAAFTGGSGEAGHVAVVLKLLPDNKYEEEGYNGLGWPHDHTYYTRPMPNYAPSAYLYPPASF